MTMKTGLMIMAALALAACGKSKPADDPQLTVMNSIGPIEGTINDMSAIETVPAADEPTEDRATPETKAR